MYKQLIQSITKGIVIHTRLNFHAKTHHSVQLQKNISSLKAFFKRYLNIFKTTFIYIRCNNVA